MTITLHGVTYNFANFFAHSTYKVAVLKPTVFMRPKTAPHMFRPQLSPSSMLCFTKDILRILQEPLHEYTTVSFKKWCKINK
jgi:hypothetical protein